MNAQEFATKAHEGQLRKGNGKPYITHCEAVANLVDSWCQFLQIGELQRRRMVAAAWLHDTIEDCGVTLGDLLQNFDVETAVLVLGMTSASKMNCPNEPRVVRKRVDNDVMCSQPLTVQIIKACDIIHNASEIDACGIEFATRWRIEKTVMVKEALGRLRSEASVLWHTALRAVA